MIAAKAFDPVLGIDIHIIQPPGPVPPLPIPHPFIGLLIDPFDFAPIIGATVMVNGLPRATAGTGGKCIPPHIPIGGVFVKPPANECDVFMGSSTVLADGDPLSFLGMPALSCHCIGMPPIPRLKKKRRVMSLVLPTTVVLAVPMGAPVMVGGPPTISMMALGMKAGLAALGKVFKKLRKLQKASRRMKAVSDKVHAAAKKAMNKLGVPPSVQNRVHRSICKATGHPVDVATGKVFTEAVDFELGGPIPFKWERVWYSSSTYDGPLGYGWHHSYDESLIVDDLEGVVAVRTSDGRALAFPSLVEGDSVTEPKERLTLFRDSRGYATRNASGLVHRFAPRSPLESLRRVASIEDRNGSALTFSYDGAGRLNAIRDCAGRVISVESDERGCIVALWAPHPVNAQDRIAVARYRYDDAGNLIEAKDGTGAAAGYQYRGHLLVRETDRSGYSFHFEYDGDVPGARCTRTFGDDGVFTRALSYAPEEYRTTVTDGYEQTMVYCYSAAGVVERLIGPSGEETQYIWDDVNRLVGQVDPLGRSTTYGFDRWGNQTRATDASGATTSTLYDERNLVGEHVDATGATWGYAYDDRGNLASVANPLGRTMRYTNDARGLPIEIGDAGGGVTHLVWDERGELASFTDRAGRTTRFAYDNLGRLVEAVDPLGQRRRYEYDAMARLTSLTLPDGSREQFEYDGMGRLTVYADSLGRKREFRYRFGDEPTERIDDGARTTHFSYDLENRLVGIVNANGARYTLEYDANDNVRVEVGFDGRTHHYTYDVSGQLIRSREGGADSEAPECTIDYVRDALGRLVKKIQPDGVSTFGYDPRGRLVSAVNAGCQIVFNYDPVGNLLTERQGNHTILHEYDALGNRVKTTYPTGEVIAFAFADVGRVSAVTLDGRPILTREYDHASRERKRGQGTVDTFYDYDPAGRLQSQIARHGNNVLISREYVYDDAGRLTSVSDASDGRTSMTYDALGRLTQMLGRQAREVLAFDPADNLLDTADPPPGGMVRDNRLLSFRGIRFEYDAFGNVVAKRDAGGRLYRFRYDSEHRLVELRSEQHGAVTRTEYRYDALGRRIAKWTNGEDVTFIWSGNRLLQERSGGKSSSYIYGPRELVPLATWSGTDGSRALLHFHCDHLGTPRELTSHETGEVVWKAAPRLWSKDAAEGGTVRQHFRYQGQYCDSESGLHYNRFRYFDPDVGRYLTQDPAGLTGGLHPYAYSPDPVNFVDPLGLSRRVVPLGDGWEAGVDQFDTGGAASHEIHVYDHVGKEVGVVGPDGEWIPKHGHPATKPPQVSDDMARRINGVNVDQLRREGHVVNRTRSRSMYQRTCGR